MIGRGWIHDRMAAFRPPRLRRELADRQSLPASVREMAAAGSRTLVTLTQLVRIDSLNGLDLDKFGLARDLFGDWAPRVDAHQRRWSSRGRPEPGPLVVTEGTGIGGVGCAPAASGLRALPGWAAS